MDIKRIEDEFAQINVDFLAGISIFLISFLLVVQFIPNLFIPFQGQPVTLHSVGYRTSVILNEDPGWYNGTINVSGIFKVSNGTNWEDHPDNVSRIGLAKGKFSSNFSTSLTLSSQKIQTLAGLYNPSDPDTYTNIQNKLGLKTSYRKYDYNISMVRFDGVPSSYMNGTPILQIGKTPPSNIDVEKVERIVSLNIYELGNIGSTFKKIDNPSTYNPKENITVPVGIARIYIEDRNSNTTNSTVFLRVKVENGSGVYTLLNKSVPDFPADIDLIEDLNLKKYYDSQNYLIVHFKFHNVKGYYYFSNAGDLVGEQLAAKIVVQVW